MKFFFFQSWTTEYQINIYRYLFITIYLIFRQEKRPPQWTDSRTWASTRGRTSNDSTKAERGKVSPGGRTYPTNPVTCRAIKTKTPTRPTSFRFARFCDVFDTLLSRPRTLHETLSRSCLVFVILAFLDLHKVLPQARWTVLVDHRCREIGDDRWTRWKISSILPIAGNENLEARFEEMVMDLERDSWTRSFLDNCWCRSRQCVFTHGISGSGAFPLRRSYYLLY